MNAELKAKWIEALRSGKYKQARGKLRTRSRDGSDSFCCLGVLCTVAGREVETGETHLSDTWREEINLGDTTEIQLIFMNDGDEPRRIRKHTFAEIADYIEREIPAESQPDSGAKS